MSYEGTEQHICENGHLWEQGCTYSMDESDSHCPYCKAKSAFCNQIDDTNCDQIGIIDQADWDAHFLVKAAVVKECNLGHKHTIEQAIYRVPTRAEAERYRQYYDIDEREFKYISGAPE